MKQYGLLISCGLWSVLMALPAQAAVVVNSFSPTGGWAGTNSGNGTLVKIKGTGLDSTLDKNEVRFTDSSKSQTVKAKVEWAVSKGGTYKFSSTIGYPGTGGGGLDKPNDVAIDGTSGDIYVANQMNKRIEVFNSGGNFVRMIGKGDLTAPLSVAVGQKGNVYVADVIKKDDGRIVVFDKTGAVIKSIGQKELKYPRDLAVDKAGAVYVIDGSSLFVKFDQTGKQIFALRGPTIKPFSQLEGLALDFYGYPASMVYLSDRGTKRVYKYNYLGLYLGMRKIQDLGYPFYLVPERIVVDEQRDILVQVGDGLIAKVDNSFKQIAEIDLKAAGAKAHLRALDAKKTIYTVDYGNNTLRTFSATDTGELWVRVPPGAKTGPIQVKTPNGSTNTGDFTVFDAAGTLKVDDVELTQGLESYPFVVGKDTLVFARIKGLFGHPVRDKATVSVIEPGNSSGKAVDFQHFDYNYSTNESVGHFHVPESAIQKPGDYKFRVVLTRDGKALHQKDHPKTFSGTKPVGLVFVRLSDVPNDQWNQKDPFPWFDMKAFLRMVSNVRRVYPIHPQELMFRFSGDQYAKELSGGVLGEKELSALTWYAQITLNKFSELGFPGIRKGVALVDSQAKKEPGLGGVAPLNKERSVVFGLSGSRLVHEVGHNFGLIPPGWKNHIKTSDHSKNFDFSGESGAPITVWNSVDDTLNPGSGSGKVATIMNPGGGGGGGFFESIYDNTQIDYWHLMGKFKNTDNPITYSLTSPPGGETQSKSKSHKLVMVGTVSVDGAMEIAESYLTTEDVPLTPVEEGDYTLMFLDASGKVVNKYSFAASFDLVDAGVSNYGVFSLIRPYPSEAKAVEIRIKDQVLTKITRSKNPPAVSAVTVDRQESSLPVINWSAADPDGGSLTYALYYSPDGDTSFLPIASAISGTTYVWDDRLIGGSPEAVVKVEASDGINMGSALSATFTIPKKTPHVAILNVDDNATFIEGDRIYARGVAYDPEDGLLDGTSLKWELDGRYELGAGEGIDAGIARRAIPSGTVALPLNSGSHAIRLLAEDSDGNEVADSVNITVVADSDRDGLPDDLERACGSDPYDPLSVCPALAYPVKFVCGEGQDRLATQGRYLTAINVRNPAGTTVKNKWGLSLAGRYQDSVSASIEFDLRPNETAELGCREILAQAPSAGGLLTGFVVIEGPLELNVVAVYTGAGADGKVETLHTERVAPEKAGACPDLVVQEIDRPTWNRADKRTTIRATVANTGSKASPPTQARLVDRAYDGSDGGIHEAVDSIPYLAPNASHSLTFYLPYWVYNNPIVDLEVTADHLAHAVECAENNNVRTFIDEG